MSKKMKHQIAWIGLIVLMFFLLVGCGQTAQATAKSDLTPNQAAELIYHDLSFHGISVEKVTITNIDLKDRQTALVDVTYLTTDGKTISQKAILVKEKGTWIIDEHDH